MSSAARALRRRNEQASGWRPDPEWQAQIDVLPWAEDQDRPKALRRGPLAALIGREPVAAGDYRWHISIQHEDRVPSWDELAAAGHELRPGVVFVIGVPPKSWWINVHEYVLHLWELRDTNLIDQWRFEGRGDTPS